jgi:pantoate--beta-alanine ligase
VKILRTVDAMRQSVAARRPGTVVAFAPTMGALHDGHAVLLREARKRGTELVSSIFVNPRQFNDAADLARYPRPEEQDLAIAAACGVDAMFVPAADEIYPADDATSIAIAGPALGFEGAHRPGHFNGVAQVCLKLFCLVEPDIVVLGQKDAQQVAVLTQLVRDLHLNIAVDVVATVRDADGLALSSRNARLSRHEREQALASPRALRAALAAHRTGGDPVAAARVELAGLHVDYVAVAPFGEPTLVVAATVGATRLIDNVPLGAPERAGLA